MKGFTPRSVFRTYDEAQEKDRRILARLPEIIGDDAEVAT